MKPAYRSLWVDSDGRVWVHRYSEARELAQREARTGRLPEITMREPQYHDILTSEGEFALCIVVPKGSQVLESRGTDVWGVAVGPFDEEYVVRWRISPARFDRR